MPDSPRAILSVLKGWAFNDPEAAAAQLGLLPAGEYRQRGINDLVELLARKNPQAAFDLLKNADPNSGRIDSGHSIYQLFSTWMEIDPTTALARVAELPKTGRQTLAAYEGIVQTWSRTDPRAALDWANGLPEGSDKKTVMLDLFLEWARTSPKMAAEAAEYTMKANNPHFDWVLSDWASYDHTGALNWALQLPEGDNRNTALATIFPRLVKADFEKAKLIAQTLPAGTIEQPLPFESIQGAMEDLGVEQSRRDVQAGLAWAQNLPDEKSRTEFLRGIFVGLAGRAPLEAAQLVSSLPAGEQQLQMAFAVIAYWCKADPIAAGQWAAAFPDGFTRSRALERVTEQWLKSDPAAVGQWLQSLPADRDRERAVAAYVNQLAVDFPQKAAPWATSISDVSARNDAIVKVARYWLDTDHKAAEAWLVGTSLPDDRKQQLLK